LIENTWLKSFGFYFDSTTPCHVIVGLFGVTDTSRVAMVAQVKDLLSSYNLVKNLIIYVKDEGDNLSTLTQALILIVSYGLLGLTIPWHGLCFGHAFSTTWGENMVKCTTKSTCQSTCQVNKK